MSGNTISLCIIIKDEADYLDKCLASYKECVDEIIVVDTGSKDNSKEVAIKHGAKVYDFAWVNDFSKARNESLKHATKDWIIWTDADDICTPDGSKKILIVKDQFPCDRCIGFQIKNTQDGVMGTNFKQIRMFPNHKGIDFKYPVHEQVYPSIEKLKLPMVFSDIQVYHTGYVNPEVILAKQERNKILMEELMKEKGEHPVIVYMYAGLLKDLGDAEEALKWYKKAYDLSINKKEEEHVAQAAPLGMADIYFTNLKDMENFEKWTKISYELDNEHPQAIGFMGEIHEKRGELEKAVEFYKKILECKEKSMLIPVDTNLLKLQATTRLANIYSTQQKPAEAIKMLEVGIEVKLGRKIFYSHEGDKFFEQGELLRAGQEYLKSVNDPDSMDSSAFVGLAKVFIADNSAQDALDLLEMGLQKFPEKIDILSFYLKIANELGMNEKAAEITALLEQSKTKSGI